MTDDFNHADEYCVLLVRRKDGTAEVGGVKCKLVPVEPTETQYEAWQKSWMTHGNFMSRFRVRYQAMLSAAAIDLSGLPRVPEKRPLNERDGIDACNACWNDALDAIGVKE